MKELQNHSVLYIAFHYPPVLGSSGVHRTLAFTRYLANNNWNTTVLTASLKGYDNWSAEQNQFIPNNVKVLRAFCRNSAKHFSFKGKYLSWMALPDNWQSWIFGGFFRGIKSIFSNKPDVIVSTYPIASAHIIAYLLHKVSGIPWVADFRDPMAQDGYPVEPRKKKIFEWIEQKAVKHCKYVILTAPGAVTFYQKKFPNVADDFWQLVPNGFDQKIFDHLTIENSSPKSDLITLLHSGVVYPSERDPSFLFNAIKELKASGDINASKFKLVLRASGHDPFFQKQLAELDIEDVVKLAPSISYKEALTEILTVDALLLLQADNCDYQIPAKAYEYIKAKKPVLALTTETGDTGKLLKGAGLSCIAPLNDKDKIKIKLLEFLQKIEQDDFNFLSNDEIAKYSRQYHASSFEQLLQSAIV